MAAPRILLVSYHYPPWGGSGVQRPAALARNWARAGAEVHVLTANHSHYPLIDRSIDDGIQAGVHVHRVSGFDPGGVASRLIPIGSQQRDGAAFRLQQRVYWRAQNFADRHAGLGAESWWVPAAVRSGRRIIERFSIDIVVTTSPPHAVQRVGAVLQERTGVPWIADLRDPIVENFAYAAVNDSQHARWVQLEINTVTKAKQLVVTCEDYATHLARKYRLAKLQAVCITNGFDDTTRAMTHEPVPRRDVFTLAHVGAFYHAQSPTALLEACRSLRERDALFRQHFKLKLVGSIAFHLDDVFEAEDAAFVERTGYIDRKAAATAMRDADALFYMTPAHPHGRYCYPAKIFEYLATDRPILALVHRDASIQKLLSAAGGVSMAYHGDRSGFELALSELFHRWQESSLASYRNEEFVQQFAQSHRADRYLSLIDDVVVRQSLGDVDLTHSSQTVAATGG